MSQLETRIQVLQLKRTKIIKDIASINWKKRNPDKVKLQQIKYQKEHIEELRIKAKIRWNKNKDKINARRRKNGV